MSHWGHRVLLPWALWAHLEMASVPTTGAPARLSDVVERFQTYQDCTKAAEWAESQSDMREDWTVDGQGRRWRSTMAYECRQTGEISR